MSDAPNDDIPFGYALWAVLRRPSEGVSSPPGFTDAAAGLAAAGVTLRGIYDVSGLRADADLMLWLTVYPFVRSYDWYLLPDEDRRAMLADHGRKGSEFPGVQANTVATFALSDYEWILALEADDPVELVDLMRHLRNTQARMHVREEVPFFTGKRFADADIDAQILEVVR